MNNTYIWTKPEHTDSGIKELVRIVYNPYKKPAKEILKDWVLPECLHQCYAESHNTL